MTGGTGGFLFKQQRNISRLAIARRFQQLSAPIDRRRIKKELPTSVDKALRALQQLYCTPGVVVICFQKAKDVVGRMVDIFSREIPDFQGKSVS